MMESVKTRPADVQLEPDMEACSAGSTKNLKHDEEKPHAAGSKTEKKRTKNVLNKLKDDEKEPHAAGSQVKEEPAWMRGPSFDEFLQVKEEPLVPGWKYKTVKLKLTKADLKHFEEYVPDEPYSPIHLASTNPPMAMYVKRAAARHKAWLEDRSRAVQQLKETGSAELEVELLDDMQDSDLAEIEKSIDELTELEA